MTNAVLFESLVMLFKRIIFVHYGAVSHSRNQVCSFFSDQKSFVNPEEVQRCEVQRVQQAM